LGETNYDISFVDGILDISNTTNAWNIFNINSFYELSNTDNQSINGFAIIKGKNSVGSASAQITIIDNCNNTITFNTTNPNSPSDSITIKIPQKSYTIGSLYSAINLELSSNPKTYGSFLKQIIINNQEYTQMWININRIFTTQDYILNFYDTINVIILLEIEHEQKLAS
jgi:hypothetical protein